MQGCVWGLTVRVHWEHSWRPELGPGAGRPAEADLCLRGTASVKGEMGTDGGVSGECGSLSRRGRGGCCGLHGGPLGVRGSFEEKVMLGLS